MEQAIVLEEENIMLLLRAHPNVLRLDHPTLDVVQKLPDFAQVINNLGGIIWAIAYK
jgi:hypothetical protein